MFDRLGQIVRAEVGARRSQSTSASKASSTATTAKAPLEVKAPASVPPRPSLITDIDRAYQALELHEGATLDEVRAQYRRLAHKYQPQTRSAKNDEKQAALLMQDTLTDALELLEEHLLPMPPASPSTPPSLV